MSDYITISEPVWLWIGSLAFLCTIFGCSGWLLCWALGLRHTLNRLDQQEENSAMRVDVDREINALKRDVVELRQRMAHDDTLVSEMPTWRP